MEKIKFTKVGKEFVYAKAVRDLEEEYDLPFVGEFGVIKIPDVGKRLCTVVDGRPVTFWDQDDGWQDVPEVEFQEVDSLEALTQR